MMMDQPVVKLPDGMIGEIDDNGNVTINQTPDLAIKMTPEQAYDFCVWLVNCHLLYLDYKAHPGKTCFECRTLVPSGAGHTYHLEEGDVLLCARCANDVEQTVLELQR
jgi:hypothetical protein